MADPVSAALITGLFGLGAAGVQSSAVKKAAQTQQPTGYMTVKPQEMTAPFDNHFRSLLAGILGLPSLIEEPTKYTPEIPEVIHTPLPGKEGYGAQSDQANATLLDIYRTKGGM
jgi:hypothetical protein